MFNSHYCLNLSKFIDYRYWWCKYSHKSIRGYWKVHFESISSKHFGQWTISYLGILLYGLCSTKGFHAHSNIDKRCNSQFLVTYVQPISGVIKMWKFWPYFDEKSTKTPSYNLILPTTNWEINLSFSRSGNCK